MSFDLLSQVNGNEWINFNQNYYKVQTAADGIYRLTFNDLVDAGVPVGSILASRYQIFHRGLEQAIFVQSQSGTPLQAGDYLEFYGQRNDGTLDADLYMPSQAQPHTFYNLNSDTTAYFITWSTTGINGQRMDFVDLFNVGGLPPEDYHDQEQLSLFTSDYSQGRIYTQGSDLAETVLSQFDFGEGWTGTRIQKGNFLDFTLTGITQTFAGGPTPQLEVLLAGRNNRPHNLEILVGPSVASLRSLGTSEFEFYNTQIILNDINFSDVSAGGDMTVRVTVNGFPTITADAVSVSYIRLIFPQQFDITGLTDQVFNLPVNPGGTSFVQIPNAPASPDIYDISDPNQPIRYGYTTSGGVIDLVVPNTNNPRQVLVNGSGFISPAIKKVNFKKITPKDYDYLVVSHLELRQSAGQIQDPVQAYVDYRASEQGGNYKVLIMDMGELYDQFSYGEITPLAIRRFARFMLTGGNAQYLFLIGKSLTVNNDFHRSDPTTASIKDLVPTAGFPGSDIQLTAGLDGTVYEPAIPTGRIIAQTPDDVVAYLNKVVEHEAVPFDDLWRKRLLHLSGGLTSAELVRFKGYVDGFKQVAEADFLGGQVTTIGKEGNSNSELVNVTDVVNEGVSLITFYGHSAVNITDIEIGDVSDPTLGYNNKGKYTSILVNGCNAGNIFSTASSFGENWILTPDLGAVTYLAHSATGFESALRNYSDVLYATGFGDKAFIHKGIWDIQKETSVRFLGSGDPSEINISQVQQVVLQWDPAVTWFGADKPDYEINDANVFAESFDGSKVTILSDSFNLNLIVRNFGRTDLDSIQVSVRRIFADNSTTVLDTMIFAPVKFQDTLSFTIFNDNQQGIEINRFEVSLDADNLIDELNENNNFGIFSILIPSSGTINLFPIDFSIAKKQPVELLAQSSDLLSESRDYLFELDTTKNFNSSFKKQTTVNAQVLTSWQVNLLSDVTANDGTVYYWRTKFAQPQEQEDTSWTESSFTYIKDSPRGWSQSHFQQFESNEVTGIEIDSISRKWMFEENSISVEVTTRGVNHPNSDPVNAQVTLDGQNYIVSSPSDRVCRDNTINLVAFDKASTVPYAVISNGGFDVLDPQRCGITPQIVNNFTNDEVQGGSDLLSQYIDSVPDGDFVLLFTIGEVTFNSWPANVLSKLGEIGASSSVTNGLSDGHPYILLGKKGDSPGDALAEVTASGTPKKEKKVTLTASVDGRFTDGRIVSTRIGPARKWVEFNRKFSAKQSSDQNKIRIFGQDLFGNKQELFDNVSGSSLDLSSIDPAAYPFLQLQFETQDPTNLTPTKIKSWMVLYKGVPEGILLRPNKEGDNADQVKKAEGTVFETDFLFQNISTRDFKDSIKVEYSLFNKNQRSFENGDFNIVGVKSGESQEFSIPLNTLDQVGFNDLTVNVNPQLLIEQTFINNIINIPNYLEVIADDTHPILDVTFDGRYILDGDIVSPSPLIAIKLKDENEVLFKKDTLGVDIFMKQPCGTCLLEKINFSSTDVTWFPADEKNDFVVEYNPKNLGDGIYTLQAQAVDATGNPSGTKPYTIRFEVVNESKITHFYPYPNPFSTSTRFVFTLTGSEIPDEIKIQIMTVSGKVVREITQEELGVIRIGNNITDYAWDGRDEYGDQLANGVYLYRVFVSSAGKPIDHRNTSADKAFKKGFGKLYLLR